MGALVRTVFRGGGRLRSAPFCGSQSDPGSSWPHGRPRVCGRPGTASLPDGTRQPVGHVFWRVPVRLSSCSCPCNDRHPLRRRTLGAGHTRTGLPGAVGSSEIFGTNGNGSDSPRLPDTGCRRDWGRVNPSGTWSSDPVLLSLPDIPLLSTSFGLEDRWLLWSRLRLYPDRLEFRAWSVRGRIRRRIPLQRLERTEHEEGRLLLWLNSGTQLRLAVEEAERWAEFVSTQRAIHSDPQE